MSDIEVPNEILHLRDILLRTLKFPQANSGLESSSGELLGSLKGHRATRAACTGRAERAPPGRRAECFGTGKIDVRTPQ
jgi:hypothetical protein